jgi:hypothetical protein
LFLLLIPVLRTVFRQKFLAGLRQLYHKELFDCRGPAADFSNPAWFEELTARLGKKKWFVYAKPPFGGPALHKAPQQCLAACQQAVMGVRKREYRQEGEGPPASHTAPPANPDPIVMLVVRLLPPPAMTNNRILFTYRASA